jgi:hypothetical protein
MARNGRERQIGTTNHRRFGCMNDKTQKFVQDIHRFPDRFQFGVIEAVREYDRGASEQVVVDAALRADAGDDYRTIVSACREWDKKTPYARKS